MRRRDLLIRVAGLAGMMPIGLSASATNEPALGYLSVRADMHRRYYVSGIDHQGKIVFDLPLHGRGHSIAVHPNQHEAVVIARRPGRYLQPIDIQNGRLLNPLECGEDRHLYGHGIYSPDGSRFYTTENDFDGNRGVIVIRDVNDNYHRIDEFESHGIGPHELCLLSDQETLVVANGGIQTHPDFGRTPLNLAHMSPSLVYLNRHSGELIEKRGLQKSLHKNSIRHLAVGIDDTVCFAMQYQGSRTDRPPLIGMHQHGEKIRLTSAPRDILTAMRNYCGSVCADSSGQAFAVSSPRGGLITFWAAENTKYLGAIEIIDGCGIASGASPGEFFLSSGTGGLYRYRISDSRLDHLQPGNHASHLWDNHISQLSQRSA